MPCELLAPIRGERLKGTSLQQPDLGLRDAFAVVVASSRGKQPRCPVGKHEQAHGSAATSVSSTQSPRRDLASACFGLSSTVCKISILPLILGPFLRRWRRTWPCGPDPDRSRAAATDLPVDRREAHDAPAATLEPEMSSISSRDQCLSMMSKRTFCVSAGSESRLFGLHLLRRSSALLLGSTCPKAPMVAVPLELVEDAGAVPADLCRDIGN